MDYNSTMDTPTLSVVYAHGWQDAFAKYALRIPKLKIPKRMGIDSDKALVSGLHGFKSPKAVPGSGKALAQVTEANKLRLGNAQDSVSGEIRKAAGIRDALAKYALAPGAPAGKSFPDGDPFSYANRSASPGRLDPRSLANMKNLPYLVAAGGLGAGMWDTIHGRGLGGSLGTAVGTGGGGILGGMAGKALGARYKLPEGASQLAGAGAGALLGRGLTRESRPDTAYPQGPYGY